MCEPAVVKPATGGPTQRGDESCMAHKACGTCASAVQDPLRWGVPAELASDIGCFNREGAESNLFFTERLEFTRQLGWQRGVDLSQIEPITFYDSVSGQPLFVAPVGRTMDDFLSESLRHGWPSFRQSEVAWEHVRVLEDNEVVSTAGTHLGHAMAPDVHGPRYCINLCTIAGQPALKEPTPTQPETKRLGGLKSNIVKHDGPDAPAASRLEKLWPTLHEIAACGEWRGCMHYASGQDGMVPAPFVLEGTMRVTLRGRRCVVASTIVLPDGNERRVTMAGDLSGDADGETGGSDQPGACVARLERVENDATDGGMDAEPSQARGPISLLLAEHSEARSILLRELNTTSGATVLSSTLMLLGGGDAPVELVQTAHELTQSGGGISGVQIWRMRPAPSADVEADEVGVEEGHGADRRSEARGADPRGTYQNDEEAFMYSGSQL